MATTLLGGAPPLTPFKQPGVPASSSATPSSPRRPVVVGRFGDSSPATSTRPIGPSKDGPAVLAALVAASASSSSSAPSPIIRYPDGTSALARSDDGFLAASARGTVGWTACGSGGSPRRLHAAPGTPNSPKQRSVWSVPVNTPVTEHEDRSNEDDRRRRLWSQLQAGADGAISRLQFFAAVQREPEVSSTLFPGIDCSEVMYDRAAFEAVDSLFGEIAGSKSSFSFEDLAAHLRDRGAEGESACQAIFADIDIEAAGLVSKFGLAAATQRNSAVADLLCLNSCKGGLLNDRSSFDKLDAQFLALAKGKHRFTCRDLEDYLRKSSCAPPAPFPAIDRRRVRIFIIGPGFGQLVNPQQAAMIDQAGYQTKFYHNLPNPEKPNFPVGPYLNQLKAALDDFGPDILTCASKGGVYLVGLWEANLWRGPTLMLNAHPMCRRFPLGSPIILAHGANDEIYPKSRADVEELVSTGSPNMCFFYHTANSGQLLPGSFSRRGDRHNMESLLAYDCLCRLIDACLSPMGPERYFLRTWREQLSQDRLDAECWLGYTPRALLRHWGSARPPSAKAQDGQVLFELPRNCEEFRHVSCAFKAMPKQTPAYMISPLEAWLRVQILRIERVENWHQLIGSSEPYCENLRSWVEEQGIEFEPGVHTCWAFHGTSAVESIVTDPIAGFQPLTSGSRGASLWGLGTYFARDAKYVADSHFCGPPAADGTRQMLMCLLLTGMSCLGDPSHDGRLAHRRKPHRYSSSVDALSSPEVYIVQHPSAAHPAYVITFR